MQEALDQPAVIAGHAQTTVGLDSESPEEPLLFPRVSEIEHPPLTYDGVERSKFKDVRYDSDTSNFRGQWEDNAFRPVEKKHVPKDAHIASGG